MGRGDVLRTASAEGMVAPQHPGIESLHAA
jgi:hypothetical protein